MKALKLVLISTRENHINAPYINSLPPDEQNATIASAEYSDGYGRLVQSRAQAEDVIYGNQTFGDSGLPPDQSKPNQPAVGTERGSTNPLNVVVSGQKRYNNKGEVIEQYEPYFASGFDFAPVDTPQGVAIKMYYDALGRVVKTENPDESQQRVIFGIPEALDTPDTYAPTPWERYLYSPNDLAGITNPGSGVPTSSWWTPKSETIDPLGNVIRSTEHKAHYDADSDSYENVVMRYNFDIKGQLLEAIDPYDRTISANKYSTAGQMLKTTHIDRGTQTLVADALNLPTITNDAKKARTLHSFDNLQRPTFVWARDNGNEKITKRQILQYGDNAGISNPEKWNLKGKLYAHNDEAGKLVYEEYDFQGNNTEHYRQVINDDALTPYQKYIVDWDNFNPNHLSGTKNRISNQYDALNRIRKTVYPQDLDGQRKEMIPKYNKGGALLSLKVDSTDYVKEVAYNARGQRILIAMGNTMMTRYAYDPKTFRVLRQRSVLYAHSGHTYTPHGGPQQDLQYTYDLEGTITTTNDAAPANASTQGPGGLLRKFAHDPLRRLLSATGRESSNVYQQPSWDLNLRPQDYTATNTYTRSYQYDKLGNIQKLKHKAAGHANQDFDREYSYETTHNKLVGFTVNSNLFENKYDANGNLAKEGQSRFYEWTANDKMAVFKNQAGGTPSVYTNYFYNAQGERVKKHTRKGKKIVVTFYMDGGLFETSYVKPTGGSIDNNRFYNTLHVLDGSSRMATLRVGNNADDHTPAITYIVSDHLNNSTAVLTTSGSLINREEYYPFGETSFGGFQYKRYRYNGKEKDEESGLYEYGQRYYAPWVCRFISTDPKSSAAPNLTPYHYTSNNPINRIDPDGMQDKESGNGGGNEIAVKEAEVTGVVFEEGDTKAKELYNEFKAEVGNRLESAQKRVDNLTIKKENEGLKRREDRQLRKAENELSTYSTIMGEITALENADEVFRIRTGKNMTSESGGANVRFNPDTMEIDINVRTGSGDFSDIQKMAHELKHAHQYLENRLILSTAGDGGFNSRKLEKEAYNRQNLFSANQYEFVNNVDEFVRSKYPDLNETNKTALPGSENYKSIMSEVKGASEHPDYMMRFVTYGWRNVYYGK